MDLPNGQQDLQASTSKSSEHLLEKFTISAIIEAYQPNDAKCVAQMPDGNLVTGGRDGLMKIWRKRDIYENCETIPQKDCLSINSVAVAAKSVKGFLVFVGRKDGSIAIFSPSNAFKEPLKVLQGHKSNVCTLLYDENTGFLMSGSWDHMALVWPVADLLVEDGSDVGIGLLSGHTCSVWAVSVVPAKPLPNFLTASADKTIKLWGANYEQIGTFKGHDDVVRALIVLSDKHFLSTSNDSTIRLWDLSNGANLRTFHPNHEEFLYTNQPRPVRLTTEQRTNKVLSPGYQDPFTGTNRYMPGCNNGVTPAQQNTKRSPIVPLPDNFCTFGLDGVSKKVIDRLREMNLLQPKALQLNDDEFASAEVILSQADFAINECQIVALEKGILWSPETIVPALDLFRIALLHPKLNEIFCSLESVLGNPPKGVPTVRRLVELLSLAQGSDPVRILACRSLANAAAHDFGRSMLMAEASALWGIVSKQIDSSKAALQVAAASTLLNLARILLQKSKDGAVVELGPREDAVHAIIASLRSVDSFGDHSPLALVRLLQTLIVLLGQFAVTNCLTLGEIQALNDATRRIKDAVSDDDVKALVRELSQKIGAI
ncbi:hypothetical protein niasHT_016821 [Heterodera trifolii]|uniref:PUL domain-containing protein n=1 Tax=Heterodera trifolii TaxID=157864 RepID=A0ABD2KUZ2_9BILA